MAAELLLMAPFTGPVGEVGGLASLGLESSEEALTGTALARQLGIEGETAVRAAYDIGEKTAVRIGGRLRYPDGLTNGVLSEVKNVKSLSFSQQLRDYANFAQQSGRRFDLFVRPTSQLSGPLQEAIQAGLINVRWIP